MKKLTWEPFQATDLTGSGCPIDRLRSPIAYRKKIGKGYIAVFDNNGFHGDPVFSYVASFGANSDFSHSGCFFGHNLKTIQEAMAKIDENIAKGKYGDSYATH